MSSKENTPLLTPPSSGVERLETEPAKRNQTKKPILKTILAFLLIFSCVILCVVGGAIIAGVLVAYYAGKGSAIIVLSQPGRSQIFTSLEHVEAFCYENGVVVKTGSKSAVENACGPKSEIIQLGDTEFMLPGFIDSHLHLFSGHDPDACIMTEATDLNEFLNVLETFIADHPEADLIDCDGWSDGGDPDFNPDVTTLDGVSSHLPIIVRKFDGHSMLVNSATFEMCEIDVHTVSPEGGELEIKNGNLTGYVLETAMELVRAHLPAKDPRHSLLLGFDYLNAYGITSCVDLAGMGESLEKLVEEVKVLEDFREKGDLRLRVYKAVGIENVDILTHEIVEGILGGNRGDEMFKVGFLKGFMDGALGSRTGYQFDHYLNDPENFGLPIWSNLTELYELVKKGDDQNYQIGLHAIGERANHDVLEIVSNLIDERGERDRRFRVEHAQQVRDQELQRFGELNVYVSMNPSHIEVDEITAKNVLPPHCLPNLHRENEFIHVTKTSFSSDWDVMDANVFTGIYNGMKFRNLTLEQMIFGYTVDAAYFMFEENILGKLEEGYKADFIIIDRDIFSSDIEDIRNTKVMQTFLNGDSVWQRTDCRDDGFSFQRPMNYDQH